MSGRLLLVVVQSTIILPLSYNVLADSLDNLVKAMSKRNDVNSDQGGKCIRYTSHCAVLF